MLRYHQQEYFAAVEVADEGRLGQILKSARDRGHIHALINTCDAQGYTGLHVAAAHGQTGAVQIVAQLLLAGAAVDAAMSANEATPLHLAAGSGHNDILQLLIDAGADIDSRDSCLRTPLHLAAAARRTSTVQLLLSRGASVNAVRRGNWAALHLAACTGSADIVQQLLAAGVDVNVGRQGFESALAFAADYAARTGDSRTLEAFLQHFSCSGSSSGSGTTRHTVVTSVPTETLVAAAVGAAHNGQCSFPDKQRAVMLKLLTAACQQDAQGMRTVLPQYLAERPKCVGLVSCVLMDCWLQAEAALASDECCSSKHSVQNMLVSLAAAVP